VEAALKAMAAPHHRTILRLVAHDELSGEIAGHFDLTRPAVSLEPTVAAFDDLQPELLMPADCPG
jgi:hypothetical protein